MPGRRDLETSEGLESGLGTVTTSALPARYEVTTLFLVEMAGCKTHGLALSDRYRT